ncbi:MAG: glycosyltransferase family 4 protein [Candidatus Pacebacteria bacterium]|nr:glycosyltransferase family 4 protein [Candidatus Paceibacterota bacterium]
MKRLLPKKILIACYYLDPSGSSTFMQAVADFLVARGYIITIFTLVISDDVRVTLERKHIRVVNDASLLRRSDVDFIIAQHTIPTLLARKAIPHAPMIYFSHSPSAVENPPSIPLGIAHYIAISEEIRNKLINESGIKSKDISLIWNGVDLERFRPTAPLHRHVDRILFMSSRYQDKNLRVVKAAAQKIGATLTVLGKRHKTIHVEKYINRSDIVITLSRGAMESMACGRPVVIYDYQGGEGLITATNCKALMKCNFSGRTRHINYTPAQLVAEIKKYKPSLGPASRAIAERNFDIQETGQKILDLILRYKDAETDIDCHAIPSRELAWLVKRVSYFAEKQRRS